jgi:hypothetical protein
MKEALLKMEWTRGGEGGEGDATLKRTANTSHRKEEE